MKNVRSININSETRGPANLNILPVESTQRLFVFQYRIITNQYGNSVFQTKNVFIFRRNFK